MISSITKCESRFNDGESETAGQRAGNIGARLLVVLSVPGECDLVEDAGSEPFGGACHRLACKRAVKADGRLVVRERPDHQALQPALHQVTPCCGEQLAAEAEALKFRPQIKLVDLSVVIQAASAVAAVIGITGDALAEGQHGNPAALANRTVPPLRAAPV